MRIGGAARVEVAKRISAAKQRLAEENDEVNDWVIARLGFRAINELEFAFCRTIPSIAAASIWKIGYRTRSLQPMLPDGDTGVKWQVFPTRDRPVPRIKRCCFLIPESRHLSEHFGNGQVRWFCVIIERLWLCWLMTFRSR